MAKVLKVKRDQLTELGDGFDVLTDAEVAESGITVGDDEVVAVARPGPVQPLSGDSGKTDPDLGMLQSRLHTVNQESAQRRIKLKESESTISSLQNENAQLKQQLADRALADTKREAKELFGKVVKAKKLEFVSTEAGDDVSEMVLGQIDFSKPVTEEVLSPLLDGVVEKKKYVLKPADLSSTGAGKQSASGVESAVDIDLEQVARDFNLPYKAEGAK